MRLIVIGESLALFKASLKVFCLILRLTWGFNTMLDNFGSLIRLWNGGEINQNENRVHGKTRVYI